LIKSGQNTKEKKFPQYFEGFTPVEALLYKALNREERIKNMPHREMKIMEEVRKHSCPANV
jgi:hypothetical protein